MSQEADILAHLKKGLAITSMQALSLYGAGRLSARIHDLKQNGHDIHSRMIKVLGRHGNTKRVAQYFMVEKINTGETD